jgi:hypothetical protein
VLFGWEGKREFLLEGKMVGVNSCHQPDPALAHGVIRRV